MQKKKSTKIRKQLQQNQQSYQWIVVFGQRYGGWTLWILLAIAAFYFTGNFVWNSFFDPGYRVADSGMFSALLWNNDYRLLQAPLVPAALIANTKSFYELHIALFFVPITYLSYLFPLPPEKWFALFMALSMPPLVIVFILAAEDFIKFHYAGMGGKKLISAAIGLILALNSMVLGIFGFPHFEIWIISLLCVFLWTLTTDNKLLSWVVLLLLMLVREDAGFHVCAVLGTVMLWRLINGIDKKNKNIKKILIGSRPILVYMIFAFVYSALMMLILVVWGTPPLRTITIDGWGSRLLTIATQVEWVYLFSVLLFSSALFRRWDWSLGLFSCLPWVLYNSITSELPSTLQLYYSFPLVIAVFWPLISHRLVPVAHVSLELLNKGTSNWLHHLRCNSCYSICFLFIFTITSIIRPLTPDIDSVPLLYFFKKGLLPPSLLTQTNIDAWMEFHRQHQDKTLTDRKMASIRPHLFNHQRIFFNSPDHFLYCDADYLVLHRNSIRYNLRKLYAAIKIFNFEHLYHLEKTSFFIFSNRDLCPRGHCAGNLSLSTERLLTEALEKDASNQYRTRSMTFAGCAMRTTVGKIEGTARIIGPDAAVATMSLAEIPMREGKYRIALDYLYKGEGLPTLQILSDDGNSEVSLRQNEPSRTLIVDTIEFSGAITPITIVITYPGQGELQVRSITLKP